MFRYRISKRTLKKFLEHLKKLNSIGTICQVYDRENDTWILVINIWGDIYTDSTRAWICSQLCDCERKPELDYLFQ